MTMTADCRSDEQQKLQARGAAAQAADEREVLDIRIATRRRAEAVGSGAAADDGGGVPSEAASHPRRPIPSHPNW